MNKLLTSSSSEACIGAKEMRKSKSEQVMHALRCLRAPGGSAWWGGKLAAGWPRGRVGALTSPVFSLAV